MNQFPIGYVLDTFPAASETFILREIQQLQRDGMALALAALHRPDRILHPEAERIAAGVLYRPGLLSLAFWRQAGPEMLRPMFWTSAFGLLMEALRETMQRHLADRQPGPQIRTAIRMLLHLLPTGAWLAAQFRQEKVCHVHAHFLGAPAIAGRVAARLLGVSFSLSVHGSDLRRPTPLQTGNVSAARFVLTCTAENRQTLQHRFPLEPARIHLVYHGLDLERYSLPDLESPTDRRARPPLILCVGRLVPKKGIDVLIQACQKLEDEGTAFRCEIIGDGPEQTRLVDEVHRRRLEHRIYFWGACSQDQVREAYRRATIFALPCRVAEDGDQDGLPNVLVEALAMGVPVISTPVGAVSELIVPGETGSLVPPDNPEALAIEITRLIHDLQERKKLSAAGRQRVERDFDLRANRVRVVFLEELGISFEQP